MENQKTKKYFSIDTKGVGYINDIDVIQGADGPFTVAKVALLSGGGEDGVDYVYYDVVVASNGALDGITKIIQTYDITKEKLVFKIHLVGIKAVPFVFKAGSSRAGELGTNLKSRLVGLELLSVNGKPVMKLPEETSEELKVAEGNPSA